MVKTQSRLGAIILAATLALAGCSALKLGYASLPNLARWWLDGYLDLREEQLALLQDKLQQLHEWHRTHELETLVDLLARMEQLAPGPVTPQQACAIAQALRARLQRLADAAAPAMAELALQLQPRQIQHLERRLRSKEADWRRDFVEAPQASRLDRRLRRTLDRAETLYGRLDEAQRELLRERLRHSTFDAAQFAAERQRRQQDLLATLRAARQQPEQATELLGGWLHRLLRSPDPQAAALQDAWQQESCQLFAALHEATTQAQRERALRRLQAWQRDLRELAGGQP